MKRTRTVLMNRLRNPMAPVWVVALCFSIGQGVVWSVLALYAVSLGAGMSVIGLLLATYGGTRIFRVCSSVGKVHCGAPKRPRKRL